MKKSHWLLVRCLLSAGALAWVFSKTPFHSVFEILRSGDLALIGAGVALNVATRWAAAERTQVMNRALGLWVTRGQTLSTLFISNFYALLSPGPWLSSVVTVYRYKALGAPIAGSIGSLLASRAVEAFAFAFWGSVLASYDPPLGGSARNAAIEVVCGLAVAVAVALEVWNRRQRRVGDPRGAASLASPMMAVPAVDDTAATYAPTERRLIGKLQLLRTQLLRIGPAASAKALLPATLQVLMSGAALALLARGVGYDVPWISGIWIAAVVYAVVLLPISIVGLGVRDATLVKCFAFLGITPRAAVAVSLLCLLDQLISAAIGAVLQLSIPLRPAAARTAVRP